jgi:hypothetical protein
MDTNTAEAPSSEISGGVLLERGLKIAGESVAPGASLLLDGKVVPGVAHFLAGMLARAVFGPVGVILVAADSYSRSVSGKSLLEQLQGATK